MSEVMQTYLTVAELAEKFRVGDDTIRRRFDPFFVRVAGKKLKPLRVHRDVVIRIEQDATIGPARPRKKRREIPEHALSALAEIGA